MKIANLNDRAVVVVDDRAIDVASASDGRFGPDPMSLYDQWDDFTRWAAKTGVATATVAKAMGAPFDTALLRCPVPHPRQVFAIGLNYRAHAEESGMPVPTVPATFTKFPASLGGPYDDIPLVGGANDWEVELVAVIGRRADNVAVADGWSYVAGLTVGQDISDRHLQFAAGGQFSLGKSRRGYGPVGPWVVSTDEVASRDDLALSCAINGETVQQSRTTDLIFSVPQLVSELSGVLALLPGDVIFTGTPAGIGATRKPPRFLQPGEVLESWVEGIGRLRNRCV